MDDLRYVVVLSEDDPVARGVAARWPSIASAGTPAEPHAVAELAPGVGVLRRPGLHIHDDALRVPAPADDARPPTLVFPSVHRSAGGRPTLTVHPLGNPGPSAEVGGRPRTLVPTDPRLMTDCLRRWSGVARRLGWSVSFEATHHGPALAQPGFFVEIGATDYLHPPDEAVEALAALLPTLSPDPGDRIAVGIGGGHYAPHFTELALSRRWAFGHLLARHALETEPVAVVRAALTATPGAEGFLYHRAGDADEAPWAGLAARLRDKDAPPR